MDANGLRPFLLAEERHFQPLPAALRYDSVRRSLRLANQRVPRPQQNSYDAAAVAALLDQVPQTVDAFGTRAFFDAPVSRVLATGALPGVVPIYSPASPPTDLAIGHDGVLYLAVAGEVVLVDRRRRWEPVSVHAAGFTAGRIAADPRGGVWALDRTRGRLARLRGLPEREHGPYNSDVFRPQPENPNQPRLTVLPALDLGTSQPVALACGPDGRVAVLSLTATGDALLHLQREDGVAAPRALAGARGAYSLAWVAATRLAVLVPELKEAMVYELTELTQAAGEPVLPVGDFYPLRQHDGGPFVQGTTLPPHFPIASGSVPLHHIPLPSYARSAEARSAGPLDGGTPQTVWHRLYLEAMLPPGCGVTVYLAASDQASEPTEPAQWHEHCFGAVPVSTDNAGVPRGVWVSIPSELPFHPGLVVEPARKDEAGLFTVLIQRTRSPVRALRGRFLWVRIALRSDGRKTPELFALRAYASRFSYRDRYLPELFHETAFGSDADGPPATEPVRSTPADFLERLLTNFEGLLTPIEDRIAGAYLLTDARSAPAEALEWLASWIGFTFDPVIPQARRRALLAAAPELYRYRGTLRGLKLALDLASGGSVRDGRTVVVEDFRLRRTFATILGADLSGADNPLLPGLGESGNSFVGDTLFLGDEEKKEFLAVFAADLVERPGRGGEGPTPAEMAEQQAVQQFFERLAHRVTVLVHNDISPVDLGLLRRVLELEAPAHIESRVATARAAFVVGIASLIGIDTYLVPKPGPSPVEIERSQLGAGDRLLGLPSLDPRLQNGNAGADVDPRPLAAIITTTAVSAGVPFVLDGSQSVAIGGHNITAFHWKLLS